jgi:hypothetical protein
LSIELPIDLDAIDFLDEHTEYTPVIICRYKRRLHLFTDIDLCECFPCKHVSSIIYLYPCLCLKHDNTSSCCVLWRSCYHIYWLTEFLAHNKIFFVNEIILYECCFLSCFRVRWNRRSRSTEVKRWNTRQTCRLGRWWRPWICTACFRIYSSIQNVLLFVGFRKLFIQWQEFQMLFRVLDWKHCQIRHMFNELIDSFHFRIDKCHVSNYHWYNQMMSKRLANRCLFFLPRSFQSIDMLRWMIF